MSHHGQLEVIHMVQTGNCGRPHISIDPVFLEWAYAHQSTSGIARFLNVNMDTVCNALLDYGIVEPQDAPFISTSTGTSSDDSSDDLLDPEIPLPGSLPSDIEDFTPLSFTGPLSGMADRELDNILLHLHSHYR